MSLGFGQILACQNFHTGVFSLFSRIFIVKFLSLTQTLSDSVAPRQGTAGPYRVVQGLIPTGIASPRMRGSVAAFFMMPLPNYNRSDHNRQDAVTIYINLPVEPCGSLVQEAATHRLFLSMKELCFNQCNSPLVKAPPYQQRSSLDHLEPS